ncbi:hypothetical protein Taro_021893 [Colocasia esculenta]|uniref:Uncharacterized protein n=1 Tax=Colocasia esculenta TaxID=4460 RepID=A0A843UST9_COLES|nr:hypothetical protein [Colocasia esculenta]
MEGKKRPGSPCPPRPTSSLVADLFGEKRTPSSSSSSLFNSVFPPASSYKKDGEDDPNNSNASLRGDWWQGSFKRPAVRSDGRRFIHVHERDLSRDELKIFPSWEMS